MSAAAKDAKAQARIIGFVQPEVALIRIRPGEKFTIRGVFGDGKRYELHHEIVGFEGRNIVLAVNGTVGTGTIRQTALSFPFVLNRPLRLPLPLGPPVYIAFVTPNASTFRAVPNASLSIALGEVRNTVPPPPPK